VSLTIREVVKLTGVEAPTLRMWEQRHGFPTPERLPSGHRRYSRADVDAINQVLRDRAAGLELRAAIGSARRTEGAPRQDDESIYAGLRKRRPDLIPHLLSKRTLVHLSHAIEDECCAHAERSVLFASFQRERFYRQSEARWRDLAGPAESALVLADFEKLRRPRGGPVEVPIDRADPIGREWSLVCDAPGFGALLSAWERPGQDDVPDRLRAFETVWSVEPELVRDAALVSHALAERSCPGVTGKLGDRLEGPLRGGGQIERALNLTNRMVAYVGEGGRAPMPLPEPHSSAEA
jgi:MerR family transcriptional regulator, light-induced transcriptional regulator